MARLLKYRFDLIPVGGSHFYEGAKLSDIRRRLKGYVSRLAKRPDHSPVTFYPRAIGSGVSVERHQ